MEGCFSAFRFQLKYHFLRRPHWLSHPKYPTLVFFITVLPLLTLGFPCGSAGKESACNEEDLGLIPGLGRSPGEGKGYPLQYFGLENSMDCTVHGVTKSRTRLSDFHFHFEDGKRGPLDSGNWEVPQFTASRQFTAVSSWHQNRDISPIRIRNWLLPTVWMKLNKISPKASRKEHGVPTSWL